MMYLSITAFVYAMCWIIIRYIECTQATIFNIVLGTLYWVRWIWPCTHVFLYYYQMWIPADDWIVLFCIELISELIIFMYNTCYFKVHVRWASIFFLSTIPHWHVDMYMMIADTEVISQCYIQHSRLLFCHISILCAQQGNFREKFLL